MTRSMTRLLTLLLVLLLSPISSWAAITCTGTSYTFDAPTDPQAQSHVFPSLTNGIAFVHAAVRNGARTVQSTPTIGGVATTRLNSRVASSSQVTEVFYLLNPSSGSQSVSVDWDATPLSYVLTIVTCSGVHQSAPIATSANATAEATTTITVDCSSSAGQLVVDFASADSNTSLTTGAGQTNLDQDVADGVLAAGSSTEPGGGTVTMSHTISSNDWTTICATLAEASTVNFMMHRRAF